MTKVFIGSTSKDLENYRKAAIDVCLSLDLQPIAMEHFPAMGKGATAGSKSKVDEADLYIGIFAHRYGYIEDGYDKSVTEIEFDYAGERGLDRLCLLLDPKHPWPTEHIDYKNKEKLDAFKEKINKLIRKEFTTVEDFQAKLTQTLVEWQRQLLPRSSVDSAVLVTEAAAIPGKTDKFRGRKKLIREIQKALAKDGRVLLQGFGGMGKTALAAECAADFLPALWVKAASTDALFEALARPFNAHQAIASQTGEAKIHLMRQILAGSGVKLLLVDDVWDGKALNTLMEAVPRDMKLLVTSRQSYPLNCLISVGELDEKEALDVLSVYAGKKQPDAADLCKFLGYHAFALEIAGAMLKVDNLTPAELLRQISANPVGSLNMPLDFAKAGRENIKALLDTSVEKLDDTTRQVFLAFGVLFAPSATPEMLALYLSPPQENKLALPELKEGEEPDLDKLLAALQAFLEPKAPEKPDTKLVDKALTELTRRSLAERQPATDERVEFYRIHDLAYRYARAQATDEQRRRALDACLSYTERYNSPSLPNFAALRPELDNLMGAAAYAMQSEAWEKVEDFAWNLYLGSESNGGFLFYRGFYTQAVTLLQHAALAAEKQDNTSNQIAHLGNMASAYQNLGRVQESIPVLENVLKIARDAGNKPYEGSALGNLGNAYFSLGDYPKAIEYHQQALAISRAIGDKDNEGNHLGNLGSAYFSLGDYPRAIDFYQQALAISRDIRDKQGEGNRLGNLGSAYYSLGDYPKAIDYHQQALAISREIGNKSSEGAHLGNLGSAHDSLGDTPRAIDFYQQALAISRAIGDKYNEGNHLGNLGSAYFSLGDYPRAIEYHQQALAIDRAIGNKHGEAEDLNNIGVLHKAQGNYALAIQFYQQARKIFVSIGANHKVEHIDRNIERAKQAGGIT